MKGSLILEGIFYKTALPQQPRLTSPRKTLRAGSTLHAISVASTRLFPPFQAVSGPEEGQQAGISTLPSPQALVLGTAALLPMHPTPQQGALVKVRHNILLNEVPLIMNLNTQSV